MQVFDVWPFQVGPFLQSGLVPIVLAPIWVLYVYLQPLMDNYWPGVSSCTDHHLCFLLLLTLGSQSFLGDSSRRAQRFRCYCKRFFGSYFSPGCAHKAERAVVSANCKIMMRACWALRAAMCIPWRDQSWRVTDASKRESRRPMTVQGEGPPRASALCFLATASTADGGTFTC